jgi:hypothetical protein
MDKDKKNRNGSMSNKGAGENAGEKGRTHLPGAPAKSNRQTGGSNRNERDDSSRGAEKNTTKKGPNSI